ncbi:MAG: ankyrin repeat domain-containing protein [Vicinamibacterales bacterium]
MEREEDPWARALRGGAISETFRHAVDLIDAGEAAALRHLLAEQPHLATARVQVEGEPYFAHPSLLEFVAENPVRHGTLPPTIADVARAILAAGAQADRASIDATLGLVCSGRVSRECGVQRDLIDLLCDYGANPDGAMIAALGQGEFEAVQALLARGARRDLRVAAATGQLANARRLLAEASADDRHYALAWAAQHGRADVVRLLLEAGEDPDRFNPPGAHAHSTPLHQAAWAGHAETVRLLLATGARLDRRDRRWNGTPAEWAEHRGRADVAALLRAAAGGADA